MQNKEIAEMARQIRIDALTAITKAKSGHPGGSLSVIDILAVLYFGIIKHNPKNPKDSERDIVVLSKGHASPAMYATLANAGYFERQDFIENFRKIHSKFQGHVDHLKVAGIEVSTGSLGQGLSMANGIALAYKLDKKTNRVFAILSDGELQEGQNWEAIIAAAHYNLGNLIVIIDANKIQLSGRIENIMSLGDLETKFKAFSWDTQIIDGHDISQIKTTLEKAYTRDINGKPKVIIANTIKGKGVSFMEDTEKWHGSAPSQEDLQKALLELK